MKPTNFLTIVQRELAAYFNAAIAYIFIIMFVFLNGGLFMTQFFLYNRADMRPFFGTLPFILCVFLPAVTMRLWAEEKRGNTLELLLTFPVPTRSLVLGKFLASFLFYLAALAGTLTIPVMLALVGKPDLGVVTSGYIGAALMGAFFLALGIFISGLCRDQIVAFILSMVLCFGLYLAGTDFLSSSIDGWISGLGTFLARFIGTAGHYGTFGKGVVDNGDVLYFLIGTAVFLVLNGFWFDGRMKPGAKKIFTMATVVSVGIFLMSNWLLAGIPVGRFDLTEGKIYTISSATKRILGSLTAPVTAKYYVSSADKMPTEYKSLEQDVVGKLEEIRVASGGKFNFKIFHMDASNVTSRAAQKEGEEPLEKQMQQKGIHPFQVRAVDSDEVAVKLIYSALSLGYKEKPEEVVPRVLPETVDELEYTVVSKIYRMTLEKTPKVAIVAPYEEKTVDPQVKALLAQLGGEMPDAYKEDNYELLPMALRYEGYEVERIKLNEKEPIPEGTTTLLVVEPSGLNERQQYEIGRFLAAGGRVFLSVQNYEYDYQPMGGDLSIFPREKQPKINALLQKWGLEVDEQILVDEQQDMINLSGGAMMGPFEVSIPVKVPIQVLIPQSGMNPKISITSRLSSIFYLWGTALKLDEAKLKSQNLQVEMLLQSSPASWTVPFRSGQIGPQDLARRPESRMGPLPLAVMVSGQFTDVYQGAAVPAWPKEEERPDPDNPAAEAPKNVEPEKPRPITPAPGKLILVGASSFLQKNLIRGGGNLGFFMNSVDAIALGDELVTIRSKRPTDRSLGRISQGAKLSWRIFVTFAVPVLFAVLGFLRGIVRRRAKQVYMKNYAEVNG